jgi:hypothetical protein
MCWGACLRISLARACRWTCVAGRRRSAVICGDLPRRGNFYNLNLLQKNGGEGGPVTFPAFKAGDSTLREPNGGFDFHTPPPKISRVIEVPLRCSAILD